MNPIEALDAWLSEEGVLTGARSVRHMEFDCNWREPYYVVLAEWHDPKVILFIGESRRDLHTAIRSALAKARGAQ